METSEMAAPAPKKNLEGTIVTGRGLQQYENCLGFSAELLRDKKVLNFGSGHSHLEKQLRDRGIQSSVVNLDIIDEPKSFHNPLRFYASIPISLYRKFQENRGAETTKIREFERKLAGIDDRKYVKYDGRNIPFPDQSFDHVLALYSTYQIPSGHKAQVYRELLRVGKHIHMGPIFKKDYDIIAPLAQKLGFEIIACQSLEKLWMQRLIGQGINIKNNSEYDRYRRSNSYEDRVNAPRAKDMIIAIPYGPALGFGSSIILRKNYHERATFR